MELSNGIFAVKLCELEREYGRLQSRIQLSQEKDPEQLHRTLERLRDEYDEQQLLLEQTARGCRLKAVGQLADVQREYGQRMERILKERVEAAAADGEERQAEAVTLYAEYAIDFATLAMRYSLMAALSAMELQARLERKKGETDEHE